MALVGVLAGATCRRDGRLSRRGHQVVYIVDSASDLAGRLIQSLFARAFPGTRQALY